jgi:Txe/YoeB family toxin of toxin-antitoxin system
LSISPAATFPLLLREIRPFEKLVGDLAGAYSRRINIHHRLVYQVLADIRTVKVIRMWTHYE